MDKVTSLEKKRSNQIDAVLYFKGLPTDPEMRKLREAYPKDSLKEGRTIQYDELESIIGTAYGSSRFDTVISRWRRLMQREHGIHIDPHVPGKSLKVLDDHEKAEKAKKAFQESVKKELKSVMVFKDIARDNLTLEERAQTDFIMAKIAKRQAISQIKSPDLLLPTM